MVAKLKRNIIENQDKSADISKENKKKQMIIKLPQLYKLSLSLIRL